MMGVIKCEFEHISEFHQKRSGNNVARFTHCYLPRILLILIIMLLTFPPLMASNSDKGASKPWNWLRCKDNPILVPTRDIPKKKNAYYNLVGDPFVLIDGSLWKMWFAYGGFDKIGDEQSVRVRTAYAESRDGEKWAVVSAPALDTGSGWDRTNAETPSVIIDTSVAPGHPRRYRMYYAGLDYALEKAPFEKIMKTGMIYGIGVAFSPDGKKFTRLSASQSPYGVEGLVLKPNSPELHKDTWDFVNVADPHVLRIRDTYHMWYTSFGRKHKSNVTYLAIAYATSIDGINWSKHGLVLKPDQDWEKARPENHLGRPYVLWNGKRFEMFYDAVSDRGEESAGVGFAWSEEGKKWHKEKGPVFTTNRGKGERSGLMIGTAVLLKDGIYHLFYGGYDPDANNTVFNLATGRCK